MEVIEMTQHRDGTRQTLDLIGPVSPFAEKHEHEEVVSASLKDASELAQEARS